MSYAGHVFFTLYLLNSDDYHDAAPDGGLDGAADASHGGRGGRHDDYDDPDPHK